MYKHKHNSPNEATVAANAKLGAVRKEQNDAEADETDHQRGANNRDQHEQRVANQDANDASW